MNEELTGLWQWVEWFSGWCRGCPNGCRYCYQMLKELFRYKRMIYEQWLDFKLRDPVITQKRNNETVALKNVEPLEGFGMLPGTHDIFPDIIDPTITYFREHLEMGNKLLIVSKPHFECIKAIVKEFGEFKDQILFRFTITSIDQEKLDFWEPHAPPFNEREKSLKYAFQHGFKTSVSDEPSLEENPIPLIIKLHPYITDYFWYGKMNHLEFVKKFIKDNPDELNHIINISKITNLIKNIRNINDTLDPAIQEKILYKDSMNQALELSKFSLKKWLEVKT